MAILVVSNWSCNRATPGGPRPLPEMELGAWNNEPGGADQSLNSGSTTVKIAPCGRLLLNKMSPWCSRTTP